MKLFKFVSLVSIGFLFACSTDNGQRVQQTDVSNPSGQGTEGSGDGDIDGDTDTDADGDTDTDADSDSDSDADGDTDTDADGDTDTDADGDSDTDADADADTDTDTDADNDADSDTDTDTDNDIDGDTDSDADTDADADSDTDTNGDTDTIPVKEEICDTAGNCYCLRMAVIGRTDSSSGESDVSAFVDWLNNDSSCYVTLFDSKVELTESFLAEFDVVIFLYLADHLGSGYWQFSTAEVSALKAWVEEGNGMMTLTGFIGYDAENEVATINSLLEPVSGISYNADKYLDSRGGPCGDWLMPDQEEEDPCYCWGNTVPVYGWNAAHEISREIEQVPIMFGYSINAPEGATVVATQDSGPDAVTQNAGVAVEVGNGKVFAWADEWIIFNKQWRDGDSTPGSEDTEYNECYDKEKEQYKNAENYFQIPQFWYNAIGWVAPPNDCFIIDDPVIVII